MGMEPEIRNYLLKIANSMAVILLWMLLNTVIGIKYGLAFFDDAPGWKNYVYYAGCLATFMLVVWYLWKKWKNG
jgi:hypothetical protein